MEQMFHIKLLLVLSLCTRNPRSTNQKNTFVPRLKSLSNSLGQVAVDQGCIAKHVWLIALQKTNQQKNEKNNFITISNDGLHTVARCGAFSKGGGHSNQQQQHGLFGMG